MTTTWAIRGCFDGEPGGVRDPAVLFVALMGYNLWFTYNRLQSNGRIVSYLQVVYTSSGVGRWIGWDWAWIPGMASVASLVLYFWVRRSL